ncbi:MAG: serine/threonine-protein kinase [Polyangiales bacterium]
MVEVAASTGPPIGSTVGGKYHVERMLGAGGMGAVFAARNTLTDKRVALKWMHPEVAADPLARERFLREARASARVRHPNVVDVYDVVNEDGALFMVMELLEGEPLGDLMQREGTPLPEMISHLLGAMRGVAAAHRKHVIHRDIKPDNIFLAREGDDERPVPKVVDFGISKLTGAGDLSLTNTGAALGSPLYMSVEQLSGVKDIDARADVYAFGVILYEAVTGRPPFEADTYAVLVAKIMTEQAVDPKQLRPEVPTSLAHLIGRAMAKDRSQRIPDLDTLIRELEPFATEAGFRNQMTLGGRKIPAVWTPSNRPRPAGDGAGALPSDTFEPVVSTRREQSTERAPRPTAPIRMLLAVALLGVALLGWLFWRSSRPAASAGVRAMKPAAAAPSAPVPGGAREASTAPEAVPAAPAPLPAPWAAPPQAPEPQAPAQVPRVPRTDAVGVRRSNRGAATRHASQSGEAHAPEPAVGPQPQPTAPVPPAPAQASPGAQDSSFRAGKPSRKDF